MAHTSLASLFSDIADAIRAKTGDSAQLVADNFPTAIGAIQTGTPKAAQTYYPSTSDQTIASGYRLTGTQTFKGVLLTNLIAANIASGVTVKVGDSVDDDRIASITGTLIGGLEYKTGTWTPTSNVLSDGTCSTISLGTHTECPAFILMIDYGTSPAKSSVTMWLYYDIYQLFDKGCPYGANQTGYGGIVFWTRGTSNSGAVGQLMCTHSSSETGSTTEYCSYFATASSFKPATSTGSTYYWRSGRTYKWIAVWK